MARRTKIGDPQGVTEWAALSTIGDIKRFIAWCIHSVRNQSMDTKTAATLGQLALYLMKTLETGDLEERIANAERQLNRLDAQNGEN